MDTKTNEELVYEYQTTKSNDALLELLERNTPFIRKIIKKINIYDEHIEDAIQDGLLGIIDAAERFDCNKNFKFLTYAYHYIFKYISDKLPIYTYELSIDRNKAVLLSRIREDIYENYFLEEKQIDTKSLAEKYNLKESDLSAMLAIQSTISLYKPVFEKESGHETMLFEVIEDKDSLDLIDDSFEKERKIKILNAINRLSERNGRIIKLYFGIDGERLTLKEISECENISSERVRQIIKKVLKILKEDKDIKKIVIE